MKKINLLTIFIALSMMMALTSCAELTQNLNAPVTEQGQQGFNSTEVRTVSSQTEIPAEERRPSLDIHFIDVGQGDSELVFFADRPEHTYRCR